MSPLLWVIVIYAFVWVVCIITRAVYKEVYDERRGIYGILFNFEDDVGWNVNDPEEVGSLVFVVALGPLIFTIGIVYFVLSRVRKVAVFVLTNIIRMFTKSEEPTTEEDILGTLEFALYEAEERLKLLTKKKYRKRQKKYIKLLEQKIEDYENNNTR